MEPFSLLFVDDEEEFLATIEEFFESLEYTVYTARNGQEGLLRAKELSHKRSFSIFLSHIWAAQRPCV